MCSSDLLPEWLDSHQECVCVCVCVLGVREVESDCRRDENLTILNGVDFTDTAILTVLI